MKSPFGLSVLLVLFCLIPAGCGADTAPEIDAKNLVRRSLSEENIDGNILFYPGEGASEYEVVLSVKCHPVEVRRLMRRLKSQCVEELIEKGLEVRERDEQEFERAITQFELELVDNDKCCGVLRAKVEDDRDEAAHGGNRRPYRVTMVVAREGT